MKGRITSTPATNEHGVPYRDLLRLHRETTDHLLQRYREALEEWLKADKESPNSNKRRELMQNARILTQLALT